MKILGTTALAIPDVKVVRFARFCDPRGYFTEHFRRSDFQSDPHTPFLKGVEFVQSNESFSRAGVIRGLHFQWNPYMGKLVRTIEGHMIDLILDIRRGSPTFGKIIAYDMPALKEDWDQWIWVPPGFAHGNTFPQDTRIEYLCSGEYSAGCEAGISPLADDIDWSLCEQRLRAFIRDVPPGNHQMTDKDRGGLSIRAWQNDERSENFLYSLLQ